MSEEDVSSDPQQSKILFIIDNSKKSQKVLDQYLSPNRLFERPEVHITTVFNAANSGSQETCPELAEKVSADRYAYTSRLISTYVFHCLRRGYKCTGSVLETESLHPFEIVGQKAEEINAQFVVDARYCPQDSIKIIGTAETFTD
ncbi:hypothetical protein RF11_02532 [Thelohanellus kitauei]|uniref:Uncharacterized protein n=1 Tax=Thelohanellus kitauei TaxID=669202 RepID=A0A0C2MHV6_THEKT|nr:hypothetical protein RF11_02532 [Thelohanellus kitauei]